MALVTRRDFMYRMRRDAAGIFSLFFSSRRRDTVSYGDWSSDVCSSDLPAHVEQRNCAPDRAKALRIAREHVADQKPAIAAAKAGQPSRTRDTSPDNVGCHGGAVVVCALLVLADSGVVPGGANLTATANIGDHVDAAALEP